MKKVSGKIRVGAAGILLAGMLAVTGCGEEAGGTALSPTPAGSTGNAEPSLTPAGNADDTQNSENSDVQDMGTDFNEGTGDTENGDASGTSTENEAAGSDVNESDSQGNNYEGLTPADFTIRVADNAGTQSRGTAGQILATGEDLKAISRENIIFYFTDEFKEKVKEKNDELREEGKISDTAGIVLGAANNIYDIELWIGDECIYTGNLKKYLCYEESGFMAWNRLRDWPYYGELTLMDDGGAFGDRTVYLEAAAKLHAFAKSAGLEQESNPIPVTEFGWCYTEQEYLADLDGDGEQETFFYGQSTLLVDGVNYIDQMKYRDNPETEGFFLWDIDPADAYIEIIIWSHGPSNDDYADVYYYDGKALNYAGFLPGVPGEVIQNGDGTVRAKNRLGILQTWYAYKDFCLNENHELELVEQELYYPENFWEEEYHYTLLHPIRLYEAMDENGAYSVLEAGVRIAFPATDDKCFVQVVTEDGRMGYLYIAEDEGIEKPEEGYYNGEEVIDGLNYAD